MTLLLASRSEARRRMLEAAGIAVQLADAAMNEEQVKADLVAQGASPLTVAKGLADAKGLSVAAPPEALVLGADQTLELDDGRMLSKPRSREDAAEQLQVMAGRTHQLHSAAALAQNGQVVWRGAESVRMTVRPLSARFIGRYLEAEYEAIRWSVGGYRIEGVGVQLFDRVEGSHFAILGLPLLPLLAALRERGMGLG